MTTAIIDYGSGNLRSAEKAFARMSCEVDGGKIIVTADPDLVAQADRIVLPGVGAFADCRRGLMAVDGMFEAMSTRVQAGAPFLGICVGLQLMATRGLEHGETPGFDWIGGDVTRLTPSDPALKIPHMGWNDLAEIADHPVLTGIRPGDHAYFVHSYHLALTDPAHRLAVVDYGQSVTAIVGRENMFGTQFHPEKSQATGLRLIGNFLKWIP
ncbi:MAG: imidazole glycerol phosphate synthase subunit HisH [Pseudomonadota bacterium]